MTAEEAWDKIGNIPMPEGVAASTRLNWSDYDRAGLTVVKDLVRDVRASVLRAAACEVLLLLGQMQEEALKSSEPGAFYFAYAAQALREACRRIEGTKRV